MNSTALRRDFFNDSNRALLWYTSILLGVGIVMIASVDSTFDQLLKKLLHIIVSLGLVGVICLAPASKIFDRGGSLAILSIILLALVFFPPVAKKVNESHRWLDFQWFVVQPAEFVKLFMIIFAADYIGRHFTRIPSSPWEFVKPIAVVTIIAILLIMQPDFGTAVVILGIVFGMLFLAPVRLLHFLPLVCVCGVVLLLTMVLAPYRMERISIFLDPWQDRYGAGFQLIESLIAIKNGGWFGVGLGDSMQKLSYLPEAHTDFILAIFIEEFGIIGIVFLVLLFSLFSWCSFMIAQSARQQALLRYAFYAYGVGIWVAAQFVINAAVVLGGLPTKGLTLPFISAGGSSLMALMAACAILMRIGYELSSPTYRPKEPVQYGS